MPEKLEQDLRTRIYESLVELGAASPEQKRAVVEHLLDECDTLRNLIVCGKIAPSTRAVAQKHSSGADPEDLEAL